MSPCVPDAGCELNVFLPGIQSCFGTIPLFLCPHYSLLKWNVYFVLLYAGSMELVFDFLQVSHLRFAFNFRGHFEIRLLNNVETVKTLRTLGDQPMCLHYEIDMSLLGARVGMLWSGYKVYPNTNSCAEVLLLRWWWYFGRFWKLLEVGPTWRK
jgi:hypothetical protein